MTQAGAFTSERQLPHLHDEHDNTGTRYGCQQWRE